VNLPGKTIKELDNKQLYYSIVSGAKRIFEHQKILNKINVFPVPDADTGTNLASTMRSIVNSEINGNTPKQTAVAIADAAMTGARGNSGIIFAQFLYGFSNEMNNAETLDVKSFAESVKKAVAYAYEAIANPIEGTILTVIKDWAEYIYTIKDIIDDFIKLLWQAYQRALESLAETTKRLEVLAKSHVVDAGAKGFVYFLEGFVDFLTRGIVHEVDMSQDIVTDDPIANEDLHANITHRFCTEALLTGENIDKKALYNAVRDMGDSLVVAGSPQKMRVHIHSDVPAEVFAHLHRFGTITYQKVDDMIMQNEIVHNRNAGIAILTDSTCDLPRELIDRHQIHVVPLTVHFGDNFYLDRLTIQPETFYRLLKESKENPTSAQPTSQDFVNKYEYLSTHYDSIIAVHMSKPMSGTFANSLKSAEEVMARSGKRNMVFNSRTLTGGLGLIALRIARAVEEGESFEEITPKVESWIDKSLIRVSVPTLKYIIRSGRVSPFKSFIAKTLDLKPVIKIDQEGKAVLLQKSFTKRGAMEKTMKDIARNITGKDIWEYAISHAGNPEAAQWFATEMEKLTGRKPLFVDHASPVLAANTGAGVVAVSIMLE
jgi:uncharacterized protein